MILKQMIKMLSVFNNLKCNYRYCMYFCSFIWL